MTREQLEQLIQRALAQVAADSAYGNLGVRALNRARRDILAAADAYRRWRPDPETPDPRRLTPTEQIMAAERRAELRLVVTAATVSALNRNRLLRHPERPSP